MILDSLPFTVVRVYDVLSSPAELGAVHRRERFPRPKAQRRFVLEARHEDILTSDIAGILAGIDALKGAALPITLTLPDVGAVDVRCEDDGYEYEIANGTLRHLTIHLIEEPRV